MSKPSHTSRATMGAHVAPSESRRAPLLPTLLPFNLGALLLCAGIISAHAADPLAARVEQLTDELAAAKREITDLKWDLAAAEAEARRQMPLTGETGDEQGIQTDVMSSPGNAQPDPLAPQVEQLTDELAAAKEEIAELRWDLAAIEAEARRKARLTQDYRALRVQFTEQGEMIRLGEDDLRFAIGTARLPEPPPESLERVAAFLDRHPELTVTLRGHTDSTGGAAANQTLSEKRATAVRDGLIALGIAAERVTAEGLGAAEPIADNATREGRSRNRRVEILLHDMDSGS